MHIVTASTKNMKWNISCARITRLETYSYFKKIVRAMIHKLSGVLKGFNSIMNDQPHPTQSHPHLNNIAPPRAIPRR